MTVVAPEEHPVDRRALQRVCCEFLEMPGLHLTCKQAQRLWGLDEPICFQLLECLVDAGFLRRHGEGIYARLTEGRVELPLPRLVTAPSNGVTDHDRSTKVVPSTARHASVTGRRFA
jgi:hypothetical protein